MPKIIRFAVAVAILSTVIGVGSPREASAGEAVEKPRALLVIAPVKFRDEEFAEPKQALEAAGYRVTVASTAGAKVATGMLGMKVTPDIAVKEAKAGDYAIVAFIGGVGAAAYFHDESVFALAHAAAATGKVVGAICIAPSILANAGLLKGRKAAVYVSEAGNLAKQGAEVRKDDVVTDGRIVTANGPGAAAAFAKALIAAAGKNVP